MIEKVQQNNSTDVPKLLGAVKSPLSFLTFAAIICEMVFGIVGAFKNDTEIIMYAMHMFLAIVGALILIAIWCPKSLYHPNDIKDIDFNHPEDKTGKWVVTISLGIAMFGYMVFILIKNYYLGIV